MELDKALRLALISAWEDLQNVTKPCSVRLEYEKEPELPLDHLSVWADRPKGYQFLICNYWTMTASGHASGAWFANGYNSHQLSQSLDFSMTNQGQFTRAADASRNGLVLIYPPAEEDRAEAATWMSTVQGGVMNLDGVIAQEGVALLVGR